MKNIHLLPTDKPSRIFYLASNLHLEMGQLITPKDYQNLYITSDEEIKEGDWVLSFLEDESYGMPLEIEENHFNCGFDFEEDFKKIILTTDQDLIADGVQAIEDAFLEWFVENQTCEWIEVVDELNMNGKNGLDRARFIYKIIIPQQEPKQETLEETELVPYEQSLALKELGFDEPCFGYYIELGDNKENPFKLVQIKSEKGQFEWIDNVCHAPTFSQAFRFFRKKYGLCHIIHQNTDIDWTYDIMPIIGMIDYKLFDVLNTYEEAELACLIKLIEITKQL